MKRIIIRNGLISGAIMGGMMLITIPLTKNNFDYGMVIGFTTMILGFSLIYFAIASLKKEQGGTITFWQGLKTGLLISLIGSAIYSLVWLILCSTVYTNFMTEYSNHVMAGLHKSGASAEKIAAKSKEIDQMMKIYDNPFLIFLFTILEPMPVGIIVSLIAALILKTKKAAPVMA